MISHASKERRLDWSGPNVPFMPWNGTPLLIDKFRGGWVAMKTWNESDRPTTRDMRGIRTCWERLADRTGHLPRYRVLPSSLRVRGAQFFAASSQVASRIIGKPRIGSRSPDNRSKGIFAAFHSMADVSHLVCLIRCRDQVKFFVR